MEEPRGKPQPLTTLQAVLIVAGYASFLFFVKLGSARTITAHEGHLVQAAREMLATGDWRIPCIAGKPWLEKPPLPQWSMAFTGLLAGSIDEFVVRFPAAIFGLLGVGIFTIMMARLKGTTIALLSGLVLTTSTYVITYARLAEPDIFLWAIVLAAFAVFARCRVRPNGASEIAPTPGVYATLFFALIGCTQLVKGLLFGAVIVLVPVGLWFVLHRLRNVRWLIAPIGWLVAIGIAVVWPIAVIQDHPEALDLWKYHTIGRLDSQVAFNPKPFWYYGTTLPWQVLPWTLIALPAIPNSLRRGIREAESADRWLWVWSVSLFVLLSAASGKHHHYLIYALPPFAVWTAEGVSWWRDRLGRLQERSVWRWGSASLFVSAIIGGAVWAEQSRIMPAWELIAVGVYLFTGCYFLAETCRRHNDRGAVVCLFVLVGGLLTYANVVWLYRTDGYRPDTEFLKRVERQTKPNEEIIYFALEPSRQMIYLDRPVVVVWTDKELQSACAARPGCCVLSIMAFDTALRSIVPMTEMDRTPRPRRAGDPFTWLVAYRTHTTP